MGSDSTTMNAIDPILILIVALAAYAEYSRGLLFALIDVGRAAAALAAALVGYSLAARLAGNPGVGLAVGVALALGLLGLTAFMLKRLGGGPPWNGRLPSRIAGGVIGIPLGVAICFVFLPVAARFGPVGQAADESFLGRQIMDRLPGLYEAVDAVDLQIPQFAAGPRRYADEHRTGNTGLAERINFRRLTGATCIECGSPVSFQGYRRKGAEVSPLFVCPDCGRQSDGCQTYEGFHEMYDRCPHEIATEGVGLDCGVWPNDRPVRPVGVCPDCGRGE